MSDLSKSLDLLSPAKRALFERLLADRARERRGPASRDEGISPRPAGLSSPPLSHAQQRLWFLDRLESGNPAYHIPIAVRLRGALDVRVLRASLRAVISRHEALRTTFAEAAGQPFQVIHAEASLPWAEADLRALGEAREEEGRRAILAEARRPFDLRAGPLLRGLLLRLDEREHVLLLTIHHIVFDGWSIGLLIRELDALYRATLAGEAPDLPPLPIQYADFALWQRRWEEAGGLDAQLAYWRRQLAGDDDLLPLPADRPRPPVQTHRGATCPDRLGLDLARRLRRLAREEGTTLFVVLLAAFQGLLHRLTGSPVIPVGTPIANRNHVETDGVIGFFVNTLVMRAEVSGDLGFRELVGRVRNIALGAYAHQDLPFEKLVEVLQPRRALSRPPLFQVLLAYRNTPKAAFSLPGLEVELVPLDDGVTQFDLTLSVSEDGDALPMDLIYNVDLFDPPTARRLRGHLEVLLEGCARDPGLRLAELPLLRPEERHQILVEWGDTTAADPRQGLCLHHLVLAQVWRTPGADAVISGHRRLTYRELERRSAGMAVRLTATGVRPGSFVPVLLDGGPDLVAALLGVLRAGAAFVPLDQAWPAARLGAILEDLGGGVLLADHAPAALDLSRWRVLAPEDGHPAAEPADAPTPPEAPVYAIYTSGSTGRPKGVVVPHRGIVNRFLWMDRFFGPAAAACVLQTTRPVYDSAVWQLLWPLTQGGATVTTGVAESSDPEALVALIAGHGVTMTDFVPAVFQLLVQQLQESPGEALRLASLRAVVVGGEEMAPAAARAFLRIFPQVLLVNLYGPTEASIGCICHRVVAGDGLHGRVPVGRPISNVRPLILDRWGGTVPVGVAGELCLSGLCLAQSYLRDGAQTAGVFAPNPVPEIPYDRLYRTGDLARWLPDGRIDLLGRVDRQIKIRGLRIELGEIEAALRAHPRVAMAAVLVWQSGPDGGDRLLAACFTARPGESPTEAELLEFLRDRLPSYMVPWLLLRLEALPLTPGGKIDHRSLAEVIAQRWHPAAAASGPVPLTPVEEILAGIWADLLGRDRAGREDDFFALGGHSLLATRVASRIRRVFGVELPIRVLFEAPTLAGLSRRIEESLRTGIPDPAPPLRPVPRNQELPLSFAQQRLWFIDRLDPDRATYNIPVALRVDGPLDSGVLARSLAEIVRRHEALRTVFVEVEGSPVQVIRPSAPWVLTTVDLLGLPEGDRGALALTLAREEAGRPFDLTRGPLLRSVLLRLAEGHHILALTMHHIVSDGWSMGILIHEVTALYAALAAGRPSPLPELPVQYADFSSWQRSWLRGASLDLEIAFWRRQLVDLPPRLELPTDRPRPAAGSLRGATRPVRLPAELTRQLLALSRREGATLFMVLLAGFQALLARYTGQTILAVGTPAAGRDRVEIESLIGFFVNTLVLRGDLTGAPSFLEILARARENVLAAHAHQDVPFERLVQELSPERSLAHTPLFQVMLAVQGLPLGPIEISGLTLVPLDADPGTAKLDLSLSLEETEGGIAGSLRYAADLFDGTTALRLVDHLERLLTAAAASPERRLADLEFLSPAQRAQLLVEWNDTARGAPELLVPRLLARLRHMNPTAVAVRADGESLTYGELASRVQAWAGHLRTLGAGVERVVAVCLERSVDLVAALLAVLTSGAAYLPLDTRDPEGRRARILGDAQPLLLLTRRALAAGPRIIPTVYVEDLPAVANETAAGGPGSTGTLAYVLYTSGSTGQPKGVAVDHAMLASYLTWIARVLDEAGVRWLPLLSSVTFDASLKQLFVPLLRGGTVRIVSEDALLCPARLLEILDEAPGAGCNMVPTLWENLLDVLEQGEAASPPGLRALFLGGERLPQELVARTRRLLPGVAIYNLYGPTEATANAAWSRLSEAGRVVLGRPVDGSCLVVLDSDLRLMPPGAVGELFVGGSGVARGYPRRPSLTAERFVPDPFGVEPGARLYRTGDRARFLADGNLEYLGRLDHQVKIRGLRIELGEIETALRACPRVAAAVVLAWQPGTGRGDLLLAACFTARPEEPPPAEAELLEFLRERLPSYMLPWLLLRLEALPLTSGGKVDRQALARVVAQHWRPAPPTGGGAPRTQVESVLAGIWADLLGGERIELADDFFALGGHSLLATRVASRVRRAFGVELPIRAFFEAPTLAGLSQRIEEALRSETADRIPPLRPVPRDRDLPLSFAQQRLFFLYMLAPGDASYAVPFGLRLSGLLEPSRLSGALRRLVDRHEVLRTTFAFAGGGPVQRIGPAGAQEMPLLDLSGLPGELAEGEALRVAGEEVLRPFDLLRGPVLRAVLLRLRPAEHVLAVAVHHVAMDGWSGGVFRRELAELYEKGEAAKLPELAIQYADFAVWQRGWLQGELLDRQLEYWRRLAGFAPSELPSDHPRPSVRSGRGATLPLHFPGELTEALRHLGRQEDATLFMSLLAAFAILVRQRSASDRVVLGTDIANRTRAELEGLIGLFVNQLVLSFDLAAAPTFRELLRQVRRHTLEAYTHQDAPFDRLVELLRPERDMSRTPLFQIKLVLQNVPAETQPLRGLSVTAFGLPSRTAKFDLLLNLTETGEGLAGHAEYSTDLFEAATISRFLDTFGFVLQLAVERPDANLREIEAELTSREALEEERRDQERRSLSLARARRRTLVTAGALENGG